MTRRNQPPGCRYPGRQGAASPWGLRPFPAVRRVAPSTGLVPDRRPRRHRLRAQWADVRGGRCVAGYRRCRFRRAGATPSDPPTARAGRRSRHRAATDERPAGEIRRRTGNVARGFLTVAPSRPFWRVSPALPEVCRIRCAAVNEENFPGVVAGWERREAAGESPGHVGASHGSMAPTPATVAPNPYRRPRLPEADRRCAASGCRGLTGRRHCLVGHASPVARPGFYSVAA